MGQKVMNMALENDKQVRSFEFNKESEMNFVELKNKSGLRIRLWRHGIVYSIEHGDVMINQQLGSPLYGSVCRVYLRKHSADGITWVNMIGLGEFDGFEAGEQFAQWIGTWDDVSYRCALSLCEDQDMWRWDVEVYRENCACDATYDVIYVQDIGLANKTGVMNNEAYTSQYIDHQIYDHEQLGAVLVSRQNMQQGEGAYPKLVQACLDKGVGCLTDGYDFFGCSSRTTNEIVGLSKENIGKKRRQYEMACASIQSKPFSLESGVKKAIRFGCVYVGDNQTVSHERDCDVIKNIEAWELDHDDTVGWAYDADHQREGLPGQWGVVQSECLSNRDLEQFFSVDRRHEEIDADGDLLSFYYAEDSHVVLRKKERLVDRPHGHILRVGKQILQEKEDLCVTTWMSGVFMSHIACGNTNFHKMISILRNSLDTTRSGGLRLYIKRNGCWEILGVPSAYEMSRSSCRWIYKFDGCVIEVVVDYSVNKDQLQLNARVVEGEDVEILMIAQSVMGADDWSHAGKITVAWDVLDFESLDENIFDESVDQPYFYMKINANDQRCELGGVDLLDGDIDWEGYPYVVAKAQHVRSLNVIVGASYSSEEVDIDKDISVDQDAGCDEWDLLNRCMDLSHTDQSVIELNDILKWYSHNAMIHMSSPHGLEQYSGAAWGVRDVCQGPIEYLIAIGRLGEVRDILKRIFEQQYCDRGNWPQWFMFDVYKQMRQSECHGDIIVWPIKAVCDYLETTMDWSLLKEKLCYINDLNNQATDEKFSLLSHLEKTVETIEANFVKDTSLIRYGDGDWNDSLQPAQAELRKQLISSWTVEILYQTLIRLKEVLDQYGECGELAAKIQRICEQIAKDFHQYLVKDDLACGFALFKSKDDIEYLLHPTDRQTGVHYRLLPYTRGIISELFTRRQAINHLETIREQLMHPDGVRLMDKPVKYRGGEERIFCRAESAASFSREISLHYVHAHLRYCEAMAKLGEADAMFDGLRLANPIGLKDMISHAGRRQANAYFSSSDGAFDDRYEAFEHFEKLKQGDIEVSGGWRIYSSGPGIFYGLVVGRLLGFRRYFDDIVIDPVLPERLEGLKWRFDYEGRVIEMQFNCCDGQSLPRNVCINGHKFEVDRREANPYRLGGALINVDVFNQLLCDGKNTIVIN